MTITARRHAPAQTVDRALTVLGLFSQAEPSLALGTIADRLGLHPSTVHRLLVTMDSQGYVQRDQAGHYLLGLQILELAGIVMNQMAVCRLALTELDALRDELNLNANLAVLFQGDVVHVAYAVRSDAPRFHTAIGRRTVAHCTALGKAMLASRDRAEVRHGIEQRGWRPYTPCSIDTWEALDHELDAVAAQGYAVDREERKIGQWCVGAPVREFSGRVVAAISVSGPKDDLVAIGLDRVVAQVVERARRVSNKLGHLE